MYTYLLVEDIGVVMHVIGQQVSLRAYEQRVSCGVGSQSTSRQTADCLVDIEEWDIRVLSTLTQPVCYWPLASSVRVMDKHLDGFRS